METILDSTIQDISTSRLKKLEKKLESDVVFFYGQIIPSIEKRFRDFIEKLKEYEIRNDRLTIIRR